MERIWQWAWDRYGAKYSWAICAIGFPLVLQVYLVFSIVVVAFEESDRYVEAAAVTVVAVLVQQYVIVLPGLGRIRDVERWAAGREVDRGGHWTRPTAGLGGRLFAQWGSTRWGPPC